MYVSTKSYGPSEGFAVCYRQWKADRKEGGSGPYPHNEIPGCCALHGYALSFYFEFECETLDARNWVVDFGGLRSFKEFLKETFDHTMLVAEDDPEFETFQLLHDKAMAKMVVVEKTGCEALAEFLVNYLNEIWLPENYGNRTDIRCRKAEVRETPSNSAFYEL
jgi:6-pyruvoyltetrahydropterin/6-carboxytetrahydropterin synthase